MRYYSLFFEDNYTIIIFIYKVQCESVPFKNYLKYLNTFFD